MDYAYMIAHKEDFRSGLKPRRLRCFLARCFIAISGFIHTLMADYCRDRFAYCGNDVLIYPGVSVIYPETITIGNHVHLGECCHLRGGGRIVIGDWSQIANHVIISTTNHVVDGGRYYGRIIHEDVKIGSNVWIGSGVIVLPGVTIGDNSVIGAGAVVTGNVPGNSVFIGVPARRISNGGAK